MSDCARSVPFSAVLERRRVGTAQLMLVALLLLVLVIDGIDIQLLSLVAPIILEDWQVGRAEFGPALAGALIGMSLGSLVGGTLGDRFGRRVLLIGSIIGFGVATVLAGLTDSIAWMTSLRIVSGFGFGAAAPNAVALANDWLPERSRAKVTSLLSIGTPAGGMIGASLVIAVLPVWGWRGTFFACGILTLVVALATFALVQESPSYLAAKGNLEPARRSVRRLMGTTDAETITFDERPLEARGTSTNFLARQFLRLNLGAGLAFLPWPSFHTRWSRGPRSC
jgi:AAHS family 4-hydroxybenzoate transporter-like MFS transporter